MPVAKRVLRAPPTKGTLRKYGLTEDDWLALCRSCGYVCFVCGQPFGTRPLAIDHEHAKGWRAHKTKRGRKVRVMSPEQRKVYVRGVLHSYCNRFVRRWLTLERGRAIVAYLEAYEKRRKIDASRTTK